MNEKKPLIPPFVAFSLFFLLGYGAWGIVNSYWSVYFNSFGYSNLQIGILSSIGPFAAFFGLLFWGARADRAKSRSRIIVLLCILQGCFSLLYLVWDNYFFIFGLTCAIMFCFYPLTPVGDAMFLEYCQLGKANYGRGRVFGSIGLATLPMLPGLAISHFGIRALFPAYTIQLLLILLIALNLPKMTGGQSGGGKKINLLAIRHDRQMVGLLSLLFLLHITLGFYYSFFPVYMDNLGMGHLIGLNNLLQFAPEIVFCFFVVAAAKRFGFAKLYAIAFALTALRMILIGSASSPAALLATNFFGGVGYSMCMMLFSLFALRTPKELRTSAQMLNTMVAHSFSRFIGSILGGKLADIFGLDRVFTMAGIFGVFLFFALLIWLKKTGALKDEVLM